MLDEKIIACLIIIFVIAASAAAQGKEIEFVDPARPTVVIVAQNEMTEITDFLVPYGILSASEAFNVVSVSTSDGPVNLWPNLTAMTDSTLNNLDETLPEPPDLIIVPAVHNHDDPILIRWLQTQSARGAFIVSICDGVFVTASAGLLDGHVATGHFFSAGKRARVFDKVNWVKDARYVESGNIMSTSGVSASAPASLRLVEKFAGVKAAQKVADSYGIGHHGPDHDSDRFNIGLREVWTGLTNAVRRNAAYDVVLRNGIDEYSLAFAMDLLGRSMRASVETVGETGRITTANGLALIPSKVDAELGGDRLVEFPVVSGDDWQAFPSIQAELVIENPADAIDLILLHISEKFGRRTADFTATQLEFIWRQ